ncbi:fumarate hydratase [bacterium]|nr:fumarate hydratase [bacterium]
MQFEVLKKSIFSLIERNTAHLPEDAGAALFRGRDHGSDASAGGAALNIIRENCRRAAERTRPLCQDTGHLFFLITLPEGGDTAGMTAAVEAAVARATETGLLRSNSVDPVSGGNSGNNLGPGTPDIHYEFHASPGTEVRLLQKGGGCENMTAQYTLPARIGGRLFGRDLDGVHACVLDAVNRAQGKGCSPGFAGVCIGGDRASGLLEAKKQFFLPLDRINPVPELAVLERRILTDAEALNIGPMGFGGRPTLAGCTIGFRNRIPASYFVSVAYMCWAYRRSGVRLDRDGAIDRWLCDAWTDPATVHETGSGAAGFTSVSLPLSDTDVHTVRIGDMLAVSGRIFTGRDAVHKYLYEGNCLDCLRGGVLYHCGPIMRRAAGGWTPLAAGPTTSMREEPYLPDNIRTYGLKAVIGKGGMGPETLRACREEGCLYLHAVGGAAQVYADCISAVHSVRLEEFGLPEAVWELEVKDFPVIVTMDAQGNSLHDAALERSTAILKELLDS